MLTATRRIPMAQLLRDESLAIFSAWKGSTTKRRTRQTAKSPTPSITVSTRVVFTSLPYVVTSTRLPARSQRAPQIHQLAQVIRVVVRQNQRLAQNRLPVAVGESCIQIVARILHQPDHLPQIAPERRTRCRSIPLPLAELASSASSPPEIPAKRGSGCG